MTNFSADEVLVWIEFDNRQDETQTLFKLKVRHEAEEVLYTTLSLSLSVFFLLLLFAYLIRSNVRLLKFRIILPTWRADGPIGRMHALGDEHIVLVIGFAALDRFNH